MSTCLNHPEVPTTRRCSICEQLFCDGCLEDFAPLGPVCAECEAELEDLPASELPDRLPAICARVRSALPPSRPWWGWELFFWTIVLLPTIIGGLHLYQMFRFHQFLAILSREPVLPGVTTARLTEVSAALETYWQKNKEFPESLEMLKEEGRGDAFVVDPYSFEDETLMYRAGASGYRVCSRGPDRVFNQGAPLDRFSGTGDICIGSFDDAL